MKTKKKYNFYNNLKSPLYEKKLYFFCNSAKNPQSLILFNFSNKITWNNSPCVGFRFFKHPQKTVFSFSIYRTSFFKLFLSEKKNSLKHKAFLLKTHAFYFLPNRKRQIWCFAEQKKNEFDKNIEINYFKSLVLDRYTWFVTVGRLYLIMRNLKYYIRELLETQKQHYLTLWLLLPLIINIWQLNEIQKTNTSHLCNHPFLFYLQLNLPGLTEGCFYSESFSKINRITKKNEFDLFSKKLTNINIFTQSNKISWETFALTDYKHKFENFENLIHKLNTSFHSTKIVLNTFNLWANDNFRVYSLTISPREQNYIKNPGPLYYLPFHEIALFNKVRVPTYWQTVDHIPKKLEALYSNKIIALVDHQLNSSIKGFLQNPIEDSKNKQLYNFANSNIPKLSDKIESKNDYNCVPPVDNTKSKYTNIFCKKKIQSLLPNKKIKEKNFLTSYSSLRTLIKKNLSENRGSSQCSIPQNILIKKNIKKQNFNKNFIFLQNKLKVFLSKTTNLDVGLSSRKLNYVLYDLWLGVDFGSEDLVGSKYNFKTHRLDSNIVNSKNKQTLDNSLYEYNLKHQEDIFAKKENKQQLKKIPIPINIIYPRLMSGYFNPDKNFAIYNLGPQVFSIEIPRVLPDNYNKKSTTEPVFLIEEKKETALGGQDISRDLRSHVFLENTKNDDYKQNTLFVFPNIGGFQSCSIKRKENPQPTNSVNIDIEKPTNSVNTDSFQKNDINEKKSKLTKNKKNQNNKLCTSSLSTNNLKFTYINISNKNIYGIYNTIISDLLGDNKKLENDQETQELNLKEVELPLFIRNLKTEDIYFKNQNQFEKDCQLNFSYLNPFKDSVNDSCNRFGKTFSFATRTEKGDHSTTSKDIEKLICIPQSKLPIPQLDSTLIENDKIFKYAIPKNQLDSLFYSYQIPFRSKNEWNTHFDKWKNRLNNWKTFYQGTNIKDNDFEEGCYEFDQLINELIFTKINKNAEFIVSLINKNEILERKEINQSLSFFDNQNFFSSVGFGSGSWIQAEVQNPQKTKSFLLKTQNPVENTGSTTLTDCSKQTQIYQYLPYAEGQMIEHYSPQNQGGVRFGSVGTVYGISQNDPTKKHQLVYTIEPLTFFSIGAIFQFSFLFSNIMFLKYFYKLYGKELIQFMLNSTGWLQEADENSQKEIELNELEKALLIVKKPQKRLKNIAGIKSLLPEISLIIWYLRHAPKRIFWRINYHLTINILKSKKEFFQNPKTEHKTTQTPLSLGDIMPKGVLLIGPPGTGKTFLVQALAGESERPALVQSAGFLVSDPQLGLTRLEYLLDQAQKLAPCIVFIDEIDTLGATRELVLKNPLSENTIMNLLYNQFNSKETQHLEFDFEQKDQQININNLGGNFELSNNNSFGFAETENLNGQSEFSNRVSSAIANQSIAESEARKNQLSLLTQFLIEMDGLKANKQILFIGATNRAAVLDPALTRPGRFDKVLKIDLPGKNKRIEILKLYSRNLGTNFSEKKDWTYLANQTVGLSAADLAAIMNQSSIKAILTSFSKNFYSRALNNNNFSFSNEITFSDFRKIKNKTNKHSFQSKIYEHHENQQHISNFKKFLNSNKNIQYKNELYKVGEEFPKIVYTVLDKPIHTLQTIEHGFNTIVNANKRELMKINEFSSKFVGFEKTQDSNQKKSKIKTVYPLNSNIIKFFSKKITTFKQLAK